MVSHDNSFLNSICNVILHLEWGTLTRYKGDYENFEKVYATEKRNLEASYERQQKEIHKLEEFIAKNKARVATTNLAKSRQKVLDKMDIITLADTPTAKARWVLIYNHFQIYSKAYKTNKFL